MRITFEIEAKDLKQIQKITGHRKKSQAIRHALVDFVRMHERRVFIEKALTGQTNFPLTNEELEAFDTHLQPGKGSRHYRRGLKKPALNR